MLIRKRTKEGFRNPRYDEFNRRAGFVAFSLMTIGFVVLVIFSMVD